MFVRAHAPTLAISLALCVAGCALAHERETTRDAAADAVILVDGGPGCPAPTAYFEPGCGATDAPVTPGCYRPCAGAGDASCSAGTVCRRTDVNPCLCRPGLDCCGACGAEAWLCLPPPPVRPCEARSYCDCTGACVPLIDLTTGCVCPCDEPFLCGGPPCDCDCGGATYLGCASVGACATPELGCPAGQRALLRDGCPACVGTR